MDSSSMLADEKDQFLTSIAGSVGVALIASFFELTDFFVLSSFMLLMLSVPPLLQWIACDEPPLAIRGELLAYVLPCLCFIVTYALPPLVALTLCRASSMVANMWRILIWHLSEFWMSHTLFLLALYLDPGIGRTLYKTVVRLLQVMLYNGVSAMMKGWRTGSEICWKQYDTIVSARDWLVEARKPKTSFTYPAPDPRIRLLKLSRRDPFSEISCRLESFPLHKTPNYEAISYRWDDGKRRKDIVVNNLLLSVSLRAYEVLKGRSSLLRSRWIWIDAICIDQDSEQDKTNQVRLMGAIYRNATRVIVWLESAGLSRYETSTTLNLLYIVSFINAGLFMSIDRLRQDFMEKGRPGRGSDRWRGMNKLLRHEWFGRVWMVQEVVVASKVHAIYGGAYLDWEQFSSAMYAMGKTELGAIVWSAGETSTTGGTNAPLAISHTITMAKLRQIFSDKGAIKLKDGLIACTRFEATKPVDKIYSLQGFVTEKIDERLLVNYKNESVKDLYIDTAEYLLDQDYVADLLALAGIGQKRQHELPSWVVDWSSVPVRILFSGGSDNPIYRASSDSTSSIHPTVRRGRITLRGFETDAISELGPKLIHDPKHDETRDEHIESIRKIFRFYREAEAMSESCVTSRLRADSFWRTIIGDRILVDGARSQSSAPDEFAAWNHSFQIMSRVAESRAFDLVLQSGNPWVKISDFELSMMNSELVLSLSSQGLTRDDLVKNLKNAYKFLPSKGAACTNRMFCITKRGFMALVPPLTEVNDLVFIPLGAQTPFVIRYHEKENNAETGKTRSIYKLVGECYVHGMMDGEMMSEQPEIEDFILE